MLQRILLLLGLVLGWSCLSSSLTGVDVSTISMTISTWEKLITSSSISFAVIHLYNYNETVHHFAVNNVLTAWGAGIHDISVLMYPCVNTSRYSASRPVGDSCSSASMHLEDIVNTLAFNNIYFRNVAAANDTIPGAAARVQTLFVNVEDNVPNRYYSNDVSDNRRYLRDLVNAAYQRGIRVGVYTTLRDWNNIMQGAGSDATTSNPFSVLPLWTPRYDQINSFDFFGSFHGWSAPYMKQTTGGSTEHRRIGNKRVGTDYKDVINSNIADNLPLSMIS